MHFDTNVKAEVSAAKLGKAHIKTFLQSNSGHIAAPDKMVTDGIAAVLAKA